MSGATSPRNTPAAEIVKFAFLSEVLNLPVRRVGDGHRIGKLVDLAASTAQVYPRVTGIILIPGAPLITITIWTQVLNAILLPLVIICMMIIVNRAEVMENYTNTRWQNAIGVVTSIVLIILSSFLLFTGSGLV